ncbi:PAS domain S-box/diguanylate cyclase (GGDEF) domain-containing protein [Marinobacter santoriniensis NKSG1]|uniref:diguanylate cyclase n=1 Tax=Marinobacter santoriniensis NKSG1 TaxID=1288826 RepID=M7CT12_9GAMM|nr:PAS domain S-box/diguanylate cyclase (GGDEF) domain-containing protein [Marinobacter santoriniensis NKSG1]
MISPNAVTVPAQKSANKLITTSSDLLPFIESLPDAIVIVNQEHRIVLVNTVAAGMFGHTADALNGSDLTLLIPVSNRSSHSQSVEGYFRAPHSRPMGVEKRFSGLRADGTEVPVDIMINTIVLDGAKAAMAVVRDVSYQRALEERLTRESLTDGMTGFFNRRYFVAQLEAHHSDAMRSGLPTSVIMFDFDHFKTINDQYGHAGGDIVLIDTATMIQRELRALDVACRIGGEEFAIILPNTRLENAVSFAERIRQRIESMEFRLGDVTFHATITVGVASFTSTDTSYDSLMKRADKLLYAGKAAGRNCVISQDTLAHQPVEV